MQRVRIGWICVSISALMLFQAGRAFSEERVIVDFEDSAHDALFAETGGHSECSVSAELASQGKRSLKMSFMPYEHGMPQWPNCGIDLGEIDAPSNWQGFDELLIDLHVQSEADVLVKMVLASTPQGRWVGPRNISPGKWTTIRLPLWQAAESGLDPRAMKSVTLVLTRPPYPAVIHMDNIRVRVLELSDPRSVEWFLTTPSYHQGFFHTKPENEITVRWECRTRPRVLNESELCFLLERADGAPIASKTVIGQNVATTNVVSFPKPEMSDGETVLLRMEAWQNDKRLWDKSMTVRQYPPGRREITLRDDGVTLVDGRSLFPFGMYASPATELDYLKNMGFNTAHS